MKPKIAPYLRMTRGGPPACWDQLRVRSLDTGKVVPDVLEVDVSLRYVIVHARCSDGHLRFSDGQAMQERRSGNFQVEYREDGKG